ncbi:MAG: putative toxin-antitoxin system toxin component, PIN family [Muribaculaceae bacterium]|nr:putative toxin-antitoxin system toxin component, PIN family [Bacteroidales bacterium]MDY4649443.1 putative toxin-antitoxin system toxin component, PIN family [Muribaculaceae bacterium]MDY5388008.1 putative toxin-antitoxin system toxin component, PIN family [Muribaculaceae bacterium]
MIYAVIDTNVIVSALITKNSEAATIHVIRAVLNGQVVPVYNKAILREYEEVLKRKKFHLDESVVDSMISYFMAFGVEEEQIHTDLAFQDEDDRVFYEVSLSNDDAYLVTGNLKHYPRTIKVLTPSEFVKLL